MNSWYFAVTVVTSVAYRDRGSQGRNQDVLFNLGLKVGYGLCRMKSGGCRRLGYVSWPKSVDW